MTPTLVDQINAAAKHAEGAAIARYLNYEPMSENGVLIHHLRFEERHIGNPVIRALHGGAIASLLEFSAVATLSSHVAHDVTIRVVNLNVDYLRSSSAKDMSVHIDIKRLGRRVAFLEGVGWQEDRDKPVATAQICASLS